jgi:hypothetical protein
MVLEKHLKYILCFIFGVAFLFVHAQEDGGKRLRNSRKNPVVKTRISLSPAIGLYRANKNHTSGTKPKMAFCASLKEEIRLNNSNTSFLMIGVEYMMHGLSYNSYYFKQDSIQFYNKNMSARYDLRLHELDFPILLKYSFAKETNAIFSSYVYAGYCYRWLIANNLKVTNDGETMFDKQEVIKFKSPAFNPVCSSFLNAGIGIQKNTTLRHNAVFAELQFRYALSPFYFNESFAPSSMYMNGHFILFTVGFKI